MVLRITATCLCFLGVLCTAGTCFSQPAYKPQYHLGLKVDLQSAGIANQNNFGQNEMDYGVHAGFGAGAAFGVSVSPATTIGLEVSYQTSGQKYEDRFKGREFAKEVSYELISIPVTMRYQLTEPPGGYAGVGTESKPQWYILGGLQLDKILSPMVTFSLDGMETDFLSFVLEGGNPNQTEIEQLGAPDSDEEFFTQWTILLVGAGGFQLNVAPTMFVTLEARGGLSITDINAKPWRLNNNDGQYGASRNSFLGLHAGIHFRINQQ